MTSSLNESFLSVGEKSELDIEIELCEELLEEEMKESNEVSNYFHGSPSDSHVLVDGLEKKPATEEVTDISTLEEFEISILECKNTPIKQDIHNKKKNIDEEKYNEEQKLNDEQKHNKEEKLNEEQKLSDEEQLNEEKDIHDPGWELIKNLSTNEERYKHVKKCWKSSIVPDPNKDLTYHSYRKRHFTNLRVAPKTRKRAATSSMDVSLLNPAKRQRSCTFLYDQDIDSLSAEKDKKERDIFDEMHCEVGHINHIFFEQEQRFQRQYAAGRINYNAYGQLYDIRQKCQQEVDIVKQQYMFRANQCTSELNSNINELNNAREEVLKFYSFYKSSNSNDPTILTTAQLRELDEIENVYSQFNKLYK